MREIKFRAWHRKMKIMSEPFNPLQKEYGVTFTNTPYDNQELDSFKHCDFMQYTGLKTLDGVNIYEGDILEHREMRGPKGGAIRHIVEYEVYNLSSARSGFILPTPLHKYDVIGNIYENPELVNAAN